MFRFEYISYFVGLLLVAVLGFFIFYAWKTKENRLKKLGELSLVQSLIPGYSSRNFWIKNGLLLVGLLFLFVAGTNPQWGIRRENVKTTSTDVFIALDISTSMLAQDIAPSRMERAKRFSQSLIENLKGNRIGLVYFAGAAFIQMPLTNDYTAGIMMVKSASPSQAGIQGTAIADAISIAESRFQKGEAKQRAIIVITDGEDHDQATLEIAEKAHENGTFIYTVGVGTEQGAPIPLNINNQIVHKVDNEGNKVITKLNLDMIKDLAEAGGGKAFLINQGKEAISQIVQDIEKLEKREIQQQSFSEYNSYFQYFLLFGLLLVVFGLFYPAVSKTHS